MKSIVFCLCMLLSAGSIVETQIKKGKNRILRKSYVASIKNMRWKKEYEWKKNHDTISNNQPYYQNKQNEFLILQFQPKMLRQRKNSQNHCLLWMAE